MVLAPHFNSIPCVALAATYHIPNLETEPFMKEREIVSAMRSERPPLLKVSRLGVATNRAWFKVKHLHLPSAVTCFLPFNVWISYFPWFSFCGVTRAVEEKEEKMSKILNSPRAFFQTRLQIQWCSY